MEERGKASVHETAGPVRRARPGDGRECVRLLRLSAPSIYGYAIPGDTETALKVLHLLFTKPRTLFSMEYQWVYEEGGAVKGAMTAVPPGEKRASELNIGRYRKEILKVTGPLAGLRMLGRRRLFRYFPDVAEDELYIESLAVFPEWRGCGIGSALLEEAFSVGRAKRARAVSLLVELGNEGARRLYERHGFRIVETSIFPSRFHRHSLEGLHYMAAACKAGPDP